MTLTEGIYLLTVTVMKWELELSPMTMKVVDPSYETGIYRLAVADWQNPRLIDMVVLQ